MYATWLAEVEAWKRYLFVAGVVLNNSTSNDALHLRYGGERLGCGNEATTGEYNRHQRGVLPVVGVLLNNNTSIDALHLRHRSERLGCYNEATTGGYTSEGYYRPPMPRALWMTIASLGLEIRIIPGTMKK